MTAKEQLLDCVGEMSEEEASRLLPLAHGSILDWLEATSKSVSTTELLRLPAPVRSLLLRYELRFYTADDAALDLAEWDEWESGTGKDIQLIDE